MGNFVLPGEHLKLPRSCETETTVSWLLYETYLVNLLMVGTEAILIFIFLGELECSDRHRGKLKSMLVFSVFSFRGVREQA